MSIQKYMLLIKATDLFKDIPYDELISLFSNNPYTISTYKKSSVVHFESEQCFNLDIILKGEVIIQRIDENGNILTIANFQTGSNIGGNLLFSKHPYYPMTITAKSDSEILHIKKDFILLLCQSNESFLYEYLSCISDKTAILTNKIKDISLKSIRDSIGDFLKFEYYSQNSNIIRLTMTKKDLAERLGIQRSSLSRELNKMRKDGIIYFDARSITILDIDFL